MGKKRGFIATLMILIALIDPMNTASQNVALKLGMKLEREIIRPGDAPRNMYAIEFRSDQRQE